ncbi:adenylyl-sulfate kinase [Pseudodesulfovibrio sp.]|uniref:adenylyl-sulfate kinase n=1 Tax=unclassified Pseudodesulfovibrio TaxID=2661612 RepID=UPI003AFFA454
MSNRGWAVWVVGLPGSGKSALARGLYEALSARGQDVVLLEMDERRRKYVPDPRYTPEERELAYSLFVDEAAGLVDEGKGVLMDGSAYRVSMRCRARNLIERFAEIFIQCSLDEAMRREAQRPRGKVMAELYEKALRRKRTGEQFEGLGEVIGVDVPFEKDPAAECVIDNTHLCKEETLRRGLHFLDTWLSNEYRPCQTD